MDTWGKYNAFVEKHFRYMPCSGYAIGSVPVQWDEKNQAIKFVAVNMTFHKGQDIKQTLKYLLAEKLPPIWREIPEAKKPPKGETE